MKTQNWKMTYLNNLEEVKLGAADLFDLIKYYYV